MFINKYNWIGKKIKRDKIDSSQICKTENIPNNHKSLHNNPIEIRNNNQQIFTQTKSNNYIRIRNDAQKDHLKEGIGTYIYNKKFKKINPADFINKNDYNKIQYENKNFNVTQRVLNPDKNNIKEKPNKKRFFSLEKNLRHTSDGTYQSLIDRTPVILPIKGRKRSNQSFDSGNKPDHDLFLRQKIKENKGERLFGVERKIITKNHNFESEPEKYKFGRKHFFYKEEKTTLY